MVVNLSQHYSLLSDWVGELRDTEVQGDRMRFRRNLERIGEVAAFEISKELEYTEKDIQTPLGISPCKVLKEQPVLATILRAGLPLHNGLLNYFDKADNAFISAYRKHNKDGSFEISLDYVSCPRIRKPGGNCFRSYAGHWLFIGKNHSIFKRRRPSFQNTCGGSHSMHGRHRICFAQRTQL